MKFKTALLIGVCCTLFVLLNTGCKQANLSCLVSTVPALENYCNTVSTEDAVECAIVEEENQLLEITTGFSVAFL